MIEFISDLTQNTTGISSVFINFIFGFWIPSLINWSSIQVGDEDGDLD